MQSSVIWGTLSIAVATAFIAWLYATQAISQLRTQLDQSRISLQSFETRVVDNVRQFGEAVQKIQTLEKQSADGSQQLKEVAALKTRMDELAKKQDASKTMAGDAVDHERIESLMAMTGIPAEVKLSYTYSQTIANKLDALEGDHPDVVNYVRKYKLIPAPPGIYRTQLPPSDQSRGNGPQLFHIFQNKTKGFFIECGGADGLSLSNTFLLERALQWSGALIEAEPNNFKYLLQKMRNVYAVPACLSLSTKPKLSPFMFGHHLFASIDTANSHADSFPVHCFPLYSILLAMNTTTVDLFSLDIEGNELDVLRTIPFDKVDIKVMIIEFSHIKEGKKALEDFMTSKGYVIYPSTKEEQDIYKWAGEDHIFIKKGSGYKETRP